jgi:hypothetical protein
MPRNSVAAGDLRRRRRIGVVTVGQTADMAGRRTTGLDAGQLEVLRAQLTEGRRPRVKLSGPQFAPGSGGTVTHIGDLATDGSDFIRVKVKVNGAMDELAFAPTELTSSVRGAATAAAAEPPQQKPAREKPAPRSAKDKAAPPARTTGRRRSGPPPTVTITISSSGAAWSVSGARGGRAVVKPTSLAPGVVTAIAKLLTQPGISEAVAEVNDTARAEAEDRAAKLRAELNDLEAVLATHRAPR